MSNLLNCNSHFGRLCIHYWVRSTLHRSLILIFLNSKKHGIYDFEDGIEEASKTLLAWVSFLSTKFNFQDKIHILSKTLPLEFHDCSLKSRIMFLAIRMCRYINKNCMGFKVAIIWFSEFWPSHNSYSYGLLSNNLYSTISCSSIDLRDE